MKKTTLNQKQNRIKNKRYSRAAVRPEEKRHKESRGDFEMIPVEDDIKYAIRKGIPAYNWGPPDDPGQIKTRQEHRGPNASLNDSEKAQQKFGHHFGGLNINAVESFANPTANFHHVDPPTDDDDNRRLKGAVRALRQAFTREGELSRGLRDRREDGKGPAEHFLPKSRELEALRQAFFNYQKGLKGEGEKGASEKGASEKGEDEKGAAPSFREAETFLRLELGFDLVVKKIYELCTEINKGIKAYDNGKGELKVYKEAKDDYIAYLQNLNNPDPKAPLGNAAGLGYGRDLRYVLVDPAIKRVDGHMLITHVTVVGEWLGGSHISSAGVP